MPGIDIALVLLALAGAGLGLRRGDWGPALRWSFAACAMLAIAWQIVNVALHWQVFPAYLAVAFAGWLLFRQQRSGSRLLAAAATCGLATLYLLLVLPIFELPPPTGAYAVGTTGPIDWTDPTRNREMVAQIWYPAAADATGPKARYARLGELDALRSYQTAVRTNSLLNASLAPGDATFPVLIYGHGWGAARYRDTFLLEELASHGYVVLALDHAGLAQRMELTDGRVIKSDQLHTLDHLESSSVEAVRALWARELAIWVQDDRFALDQLAGLPGFHARLDMDRVGALGHSFGGASSIALLGLDPRVKCAVNLDGWTLNGIDHRTTQPAMFVYEGSAEARGPGAGVEWNLDRIDDANVDTSLARYGGLRAYVAGTRHADFTDQTLLSPLQRLTVTGPIAGERIRTITRALVLGFFDETLRKQAQIPAFPEVKLQRWP